MRGDVTPILGFSQEFTQFHGMTRRCAMGVFHVSVRPFLIGRLLRCGDGNCGLHAGPVNR